MTLTKDHNNHPAHSPLTSRRLHQMRDILSKAAEQRDGGDIGYAMSDAVKLIDEVLAGAGQKPVATVHHDDKGYHALLSCELPEGTPLYTTQPAQVVPDNRAITQHFDSIALETAREIMCDVNRRDEFPGGEVQLLSRVQCRVDEACRAAMLQPGNSPAIPDGWIKCSERMPDDDDFVYI